MKKTLFLYIVFIILITLSGCNKSAVSVCNNVLDGAKKGLVFKNLLGTNYITDDFEKFFDNSPMADTTFITESILLPEYFDSYKYLSSNSHSKLTVHRSVKISSLGEKGSSTYEFLMSYYLKEKNARLENGRIYYEEGEAEIVSLEYLIVGIKRYKLTIYCMKQEKDWKIFKAFYETINI